MPFEDRFENIAQFVQKHRTKAAELVDDTLNYLTDVFDQAEEIFTFSTGYGQLLLVTKNLYQLVLFYIQDSITELNIHTARREHSVYGLSRIAGHNPFRGKAATGEITLRLKDDAKLESIAGSKIFIPNFLAVKLNNNELSYMVDLGAENIVVDLSDPQPINMRILEGSLEFQQFTGTGEDLQTYEVTISQGKRIDQDKVIVSVNGEQYRKYESLYDIPLNEKGVLVKTGITSGVDIIFGNDINTQIPPLGSVIRVDYLLHSGFAGNVNDAEFLSWEFEDTAFDITGAEVNLNDFFEIRTSMPPNFGADSESPQLSKILATNYPGHPIIHDQKSLRYFLEKLNFFSVVKIFRDVQDEVNRFRALLLPKLQNRLQPGEDYFSMDLDRFTLTETEQVRILNMIDESGKKSGNIAIQIEEFTVKRFVAMIMVDVFRRQDGRVVKRSNVKSKMRKELSDFLIANKRVNKIPHSDIIRILDGIDEIDTVKVVFIPEEEEGSLDELGNVSVGEREYAVLRGGWEDSEGVFYKDAFDPEGEALGSINIQINFIEDETR